MRADAFILKIAEMMNRTNAERKRRQMEIRNKKTHTRAAVRAEQKQTYKMVTIREI